MSTIILQDEVKTLMDLHKKAVEACKSEEKVLNLILEGHFPISELNDSKWLNENTFKTDAQKWQSVKCDEFTFSHGEYFDRYQQKYNKSAIDYLAEVLSKKRDSRRACWSLYDMSILLDSYVSHKSDNPIPSLMILQAGISDDEKTLFIAAYYRALEVSEFLPINIAELCIVAEQLHAKLGYKFEYFSLLIHAFDAHYKEGFSCLRKAEIDRLEGTTIAVQISTDPIPLKWIKTKLTEKSEMKESRIELSGMENLIRSISDYKRVKTDGPFSDDLLLALKDVLEKMRSYNSIVCSSNYATIAHSKYDEIKKSLKKIIEKL